MKVKNKKILFTVNVDWFFVSHRLPIALKAIENGYQVHLLCSVTDKAEYLKSLGRIVHSFPFVRSGKNVFQEMVSIFKLYQEVRELKPELVHLVTIKPVLYGGIVARIAKVLAVVSAISGLGFLFVKRSNIQSKLLLSFVLLLYRFAMGHSNQRVIFQNSTDMNELVSAGGVDKNKTCMIRGSGVALDEFPVLPELGGTPIIVMASRLLKDKGVVEFVEAAKRVLKQNSS